MYALTHKFFLFILVPSLFCHLGGIKQVRSINIFISLFLCFFWACTFISILPAFSCFTLFKVDCKLFFIMHYYFRPLRLKFHNKIPDIKNLTPVQLQKNQHTSELKKKKKKAYKINDSTSSIMCHYIWICRAAKPQHVLATKNS